MLEPHLHTLAALIAAHPDRTLAEQDALGASVPTVWRAVRALGLTVKKNGPPVRTRSADADLGCRPPRVSGRNRQHHQSASATAGLARRARPRPRPLRALADQHVSRRGAGHGADRTGGLRRRDRWRELPRLHRPGRSPATSSLTISGPTVPTRHATLCTCHPTARAASPQSPRSHRSLSPHRDALAVPRRVRGALQPWNAATMFGTAGTRPPHGHEKRFSRARAIPGT